MTQLNLWTWVKSVFRPVAQGSGTSGRGLVTPARKRRAKHKPKRVRPERSHEAVPAIPSPAHSHLHSTPLPLRSAPRATYATKQALYDDMVRTMCARHNIKVRRWRTSMSGIAWEVRYRDGSVTRLLESPRPKSPMSAAIFLHEVGHHVIGLAVYKPRCLEEHHAWMYSLAQMEEWGIEVTDKVRTRVQRSMKYAVGKAKRRGIKSLPAELAVYL